MTALAVRKLYPLTTLRFLAAGLVVFHHCKGMLGVPASVLQEAGPHAVSLFFVLSGFILHHVYPELPGWRPRARFLLARFARVYPAYLVALVLLLAVTPLQRQAAVEHPGITAATVCLVQTWVPREEWFFALNSPSWSISTEAFFYACFPLLILGWRRNWWAKLAAAFLLVVALVQITNALGWPLYPEDHHLCSVVGMAYVNPLARLFEFTCGMAVGLLWQRLSRRPQPRLVLGTALELAAFALVGYCMVHHARWVAKLGRLPGVGDAGRVWLTSCGMMLPSYALLILVLALQPGWLCRLFSNRFLVLLGEISYSTYLIHLPVLNWFLLHPEVGESWPRWGLFGLYAAILLGGSYLIWRLIECPCRSFLVGLWREPRPDLLPMPAAGQAPALERKAA
jgi:peptidoglycan/LPS O-acetylase OafA/YrhL